MMQQDSKRKRSVLPETATLAPGSKRRRRKSVPSRHAAAMLPDELLTEVCLRLPVKSILRFRAACRSWDAMLSSEEFGQLYAARAEEMSSAPKLLFVSPTANFNSTAVYKCSPSKPTDDLLLTLDDVRGNYVEVTPAPCHGLSLLYDGIAPAYYVMNATTRAVTRLPPFRDVAFATAGLGCDARTKKYKVVRLFEGNLLEKEFLKCEIYTLGGDEGDIWRPAAGGVPFRFYSFARSAISNAVMNKLQPLFFNGYLHWLINPLHHVKLPRASILSFSLTDETFRWIRSPPFVASGVHLVELDGNLCMVRDLRDRSTAVCKLEIWKLKDYNSGDWSLDHRIDLTGQLPRDLLEPQIVKVIGSAGSCRSGTKIIIATSKHKVCSYDPVSRTLETITSISETCTSYQNEKSDIRFSLFKECLTPVHKTREEIAFATPLSKATKEILLRLPAESVLKFKPVCKQWLGLIKSERFIRAYFAHKNMDKRPKIMLVGKGSGKSLFNFVPLSKWLQEASNQGTLFLDTKVVCSKPCRGLNLMSFVEEDYLFNPCTGYHRVYWNREWHQHQPWKMPTGCREQEDNPFAVGNKNVGLGFSQVIQDHVVVGIFYDRKDYNSREYSLTCSLWSCGSGYFEQLPQPPLPVNDMPPVSVDGVLYWMSEPRLGQSYERAIVSFDIAAKIFEVIPCPSSIAMWDPRSRCHAFVVELLGKLCAVLSNSVADELDIWKWDHGLWTRAYTINLKFWPDYSLATNVVVPMAVDLTDGRILLNTGRKLGLYNPFDQTIENLLALDQVSLATPKVQQQRTGGHLKCHITRCEDVPRKFSPWKLSMAPCENFATPPSASSGKNLLSSRHQYVKALNSVSPKVMPVVPMLYEESLTYYPFAARARVLFS
ncbi:uncharacterized protein [Oryza sativa Japonica Group]|jgi:F-box interacting protein|uniref:Os02g0563800 protein n=6 Tax=Oryza TaxID=4527 RepID=A0A0P0VKI1_ORYSJ|nr:uncharacterized protein LOC4329691 [Oryza sativa Japonica Group]KAB8087527.1 hypothetical protein EE612_011830 [Oryza sativa]KAF2945358.1 hypothetical protein DAI22_02g211600 [Oryza sativa Japonica Group]USI00844.1 F-box domain-containing protein [Oryza sativa Japonica Group]BAD15584.1 unknown protein [Oryza sativa Japonica Group]BAD15811.1 unknown protein [Oryza sativa Japonica Group]|eukprot:NP_001047155.1 Os02g0563800 [Oryza sativa Japonica Group]